MERHESVDFFIPPRLVGEPALLAPEMVVEEQPVDTSVTVESDEVDFGDPGLPGMVEGLHACLASRGHGDRVAPCQRRAVGGVAFDVGHESARSLAGRLLAGEPSGEDQGKGREEMPHTLILAVRGRVARVRCQPRLPALDQPEQIEPDGPALFVGDVGVVGHFGVFVPVGRVFQEFGEFVRVLVEFVEVRSVGMIF